MLREYRSLGWALFVAVPVGYCALHIFDHLIPMAVDYQRYGVLGWTWFTIALVVGAVRRHFDSLLVLAALMAAVSAYLFITATDQEAIDDSWALALALVTFGSPVGFAGAFFGVLLGGWTEDKLDQLTRHTSRGTDA